jgi:hypothetical protein
MKEWPVNVTYTGRGYMTIRANTEKEAKELAKAFDCTHDEATELFFDEVFLNTLVLNE